MSKAELVLRTLTVNDEAAFFKGMSLWQPKDRAWFTFAWRDGITYAEMLEILRKEEQGIDLAPDRVPHTMLYGFVNDEIIGRVSLRHRLNEGLLKRGGNIGYAVAEKFRGLGYAKEMVRQALPYSRTLGIEKLLITCADENVASWKIIEHFGGELTSKAFDADENATLRHYWVTL